eukprot:TRINITY_DN14580_c0_g1_i1.p1 TRINITY_DN14580_c0_g1~~TRINITY_DN14580_c0_g1_i1.p1  ORF type:complete len:4593 (+),score=1145.39 TRINITY_DN14580_c0_g1_i1:46-13824(+)
MSIPGSPTSTRRRFPPHGSHSGSMSPTRQMLQLPFELTGNGSRRGTRRCREVEIETEVWVRVRPYLRAEVHASPPTSPKSSRHAVRMYSESHVGGVTIMNPLSKELSATYHSFCFDRCMWSVGPGSSRTGARHIDQDAFYEPISQKYLPDLVNGFNTTFINYGQAVSGKSYTVFGRKGDEGYLPRCAQDLLKLVLQYNGSHKMRHIVVTISALSVHKNEAYDLLTDEPPASPPGRRPTNLTSVQVTSHISLMGVEEKEVHYPGLRWRNLFSIEDIDYYLSQVSSRKKAESHTIVMIKLTKTHGSSPHGVVGTQNSAVGSFEQDPVRTSSSVLTVVDLAGSEDLRKSASGSPKSNSIANNKSLSVLRTVMERLSLKKNPSMELLPPVRDSLLTKILVNSLGGNCRCVLVANISPHAGCYQETKNTLRFAETAKHVIGSLSFSQPDIGCDERIHSLRQALQDPWLDKAQRQTLTDLLHDELDEVASYDKKLQNIVAHRHLLINSRETQQAVVDKYNIITSRCHQQAHQIDTQLESAQGAMKRIMDQLKVLESNKKNGGPNDADVHILRSELEKATRNNQMLYELKVKLLRRIDNLGFDQCSHLDSEEEYSVVNEFSHSDYQHNVYPPDNFFPSDQVYADPGPDRSPSRSISPHPPPQDDAPLRSPPTDDDNNNNENETMQPTVGNNTTGIEQALQLLSVKISGVETVGSAEANQLATCCKELGMSHANYSGILNAAAGYLSDTRTNTTKEITTTVYNSVADPLVLDTSEGEGDKGTDASFMATHIQQLVQKLHDAEVDNSSYLKKCHILEREITLLNNNCQTLVEACKLARQHEVSNGAAALLTEALATVNYDVFSPQRSAFVESKAVPDEEEPVIENATRQAFISVRDTTTALLKYDDILLLYPPQLRRKLDSVKNCLSRVDCSDPNYDVKPQLAVLRSELISHRRDAVSQTEKVKSFESVEVAESPPVQFSQYDIKFENRALPQVRTVDLAEATAKAAHLAIVVRRSDEASVIPEIQELASMFAACDAAESAELTKEALRRLALNDAIGSAAALHAASAAASAMANMSCGSVKGVHKPSRLASLLADLAELSRRLSKGEPVERPDIISLRDKACSLAGIGAGAAELAARNVSTKCLTASTAEARKSAASTARRHNVLSSVMSDVVHLLSGDDVDAEKAAQLSTKSEQALSATRQSVVDVGEVLRLQSINKIDYRNEVTKHATNQAVHSVTVTLSLLPESSPGKALLNSCIASLQASLSPDNSPAQVIDATQAAYTSIEKASCTGVSYAAVTARKLAAACAELRGKAVGNPTVEEIESIARQALLLAEDAENAESHPAAVVSSGLRGCSSQLQKAAQSLLSERKMTKTASENIGKAGADAWGAAEGHCCLRKAAASLKHSIGDLFANRSVSSIQKQLIDTQQNITAASRAVTCSQASALINSFADGIAQLRTSVSSFEELDSRGKSNICSQANTIYKEIAQAAGDPGPDEVAARFIAERLNELLREHTKPGELLPGDASETLQKALTEATVLSGAPTALEDLLMLLKRKVESGEVEGINEILNILRTDFGIELKNNGNLLESCASTLQASETAKEVSRRLCELGDNNTTSDDLVLMSGDLSIAAANLPEGNQKDEMLQMADKVLELSRPQEDISPHLSQITHSLDRLSGNLPTADEESNSLLQLVTLLTNTQTDKVALEAKLSTLSIEHPKFGPIFTAVGEWAAVRYLGESIIGKLPVSDDDQKGVSTEGVKVVMSAACRPPETVPPVDNVILPQSVVESMAASFNEGTLMRMVLLESVGATSDTVSQNCSKTVIAGTEIGQLIEQLQPNQSTLDSIATSLFAMSQRLPTKSSTKAVYDLAVAVDVLAKKDVITGEDLITVQEIAGTLVGKAPVNGTPAQRLNTIITTLIDGDQQHGGSIPVGTVNELVALSQKEPLLIPTVDTIVNPVGDVSIDVLFEAQRQLLTENGNQLQGEPAKDRLTAVLQKLVEKKKDGTLCKKDLQRAAQEARTAAVKDARYKQIADHLAQAAEAGTISEHQLGIITQQIATPAERLRETVNSILSSAGSGAVVDLKSAADEARAAGNEQLADQLDNAAREGTVSEALLQQLREFEQRSEGGGQPRSGQDTAEVVEKLRSISHQLQQHVPGNQPSPELLLLIDDTSSSYEDICKGILDAVTMSFRGTSPLESKRSTLQELTQALLSGNHSDDVVEEAKKACARLRSNSVSLEGFASEAEKHLSDGDFAALGRVLESAEKVMKGETTNDDYQLVPTTTTVSIATLLAAVKELGQRVKDRRAIPDEFFKSVRDAAATKSGFGTGMSEAVLKYISGLQSAEESGYSPQALSFAVADAGKRHQVGALTDVAGHLKSGDFDQIGSLIDPVRKCVAESRTGRLLETAVDELRESDAATDVFVPVIEAAASRWSSTVELIKSALGSTVGTQQDIGVGGMLELAGCLSATLNSLSRAIDSGFADPDVVAGQLKWIQFEISTCIQTLSSSASQSTITKSLESLHSELSNIINMTDLTTKKDSLIRQANKLRNGIDAHNNILKTYNLVQKVFQQFTNGQVEAAQETLQVAVNVGSCIKTQSVEVFEALVELSEADGIPPMMLAAATYDVLLQLRVFCGKSSPQEKASLLISAALFSTEEPSQLDYLKLADQVSLIIGFAEPTSEKTLLDMIDLTKEYFTSTDTLTKSTLRGSIIQQCESLLRSSGYLGDSAKILHAELEELLQSEGETPPMLDVLEGVKKSQEKIRQIAGYLRCADSNPPNTTSLIETLTLCGGMALNAAANSPGESGRSILELGELLCDAVGRLSRGMSVSNSSLLAAACAAAGINQKIEDSSDFNAETLHNLAEEATLHGLHAEAKLISDAAATMNFDGKTLAAVSKIASCTSTVTSDLEDISNRLSGNGGNRTLEIAELADRLSVLATENPRLRHSIVVLKDSLLRELTKGGVKERSVGVAIAIDTASRHPGLGADVKQQLEVASTELKKLTTSISDYSMAAMNTDISKQSSEILQYLVSVIDDTAVANTLPLPIDFVISTAQQAVDYGCSAPLLLSSLQALKEAFNSAIALCKDVCRNKAAPSDVRHLLFEAVTDYMIRADKEVGSSLHGAVPFSGSDAVALLAPLRLVTAEAEKLYEEIDSFKLIDFSEAKMFAEKNCDLTKEIDALNDRISQQQKTIEADEEGFVKLRGELDIAREGLIEIDRKLNEADTIGREKDSQIIKLEDACSLLESQLQNLESDQHTSSNEFASLSAKLKESENLVLKKEKEMIELSEKIQSIKQQHAVREERDRHALKTAIDNPSLPPTLRQTLQTTMNENVVEEAKTVLAELFATQGDSLPQHLSQKIHSILTEENPSNISLSQVEEVLNLCKSEGIQLQTQTLSQVVTSSQDTDVQGTGMGKLASVTHELSEKVRRGSCLTADTIRVCAEELRNSGAVGAATLAEEAARRFQVGDTVGAALVLEAAGLNAAEKSAHGVPIHPRLAGVIADLAELQRRILASEPVTTHEVSRLRGRALEASGLGASFIEASLSYLSTLTTDPNISQTTLASLAEAAVQRHPSVSDLLLKYCKVVFESRESASDLLKERCDVFEECRLLSVQAGEVARRLRLGEVSSDVTQSIGRAAGVARGIVDRYGSSVSPSLEAAASGLRNCVDLLTASKPASDELWQAALQVEVAAGCGVRPTIQAARTLSDYLHNLSSSIHSGNRTEEEVNNTMLLLAAEATGASYSGPSKSIVAITLSDCGDWLTTRSNISNILERSSSALRHSADAQEAIIRSNEFMNESVALLSESKGSRTEVESIQKAAALLRKASSGLASAGTASKDAGLDAISKQLAEVSTELDKISSRCEESAKDGGHRVPPSSEVLRIMSRISNVSGVAAGDEAAARLISERLSNIIECLRQGLSPIEAASVSLQTFPPVESVAAAAATSLVNDLGPSAGEATANVMGAQLQKAITQLQEEGNQIRDSPVAELIRIAVHDAGRAQIGNSIVANTMISVEQLLHKALQNDQDNEVAISILTEAKDLCEGSGEASYCARSVARQLWGIESCAAYGIPPQKLDLVSLAEEAEIGNDKLQTAHPLGEISKELVSLSENGKLDDIPAHEYGRLCDAAAAAAGLPVRGAAGAAADLGDQIGAIASRIAAGGSVEKAELIRLSAEAKSAGDRHREGRTSFMLIAEELRDAATHTGNTNLRGTLARCKRLQSTLSGPDHTEMGTQWPDAEGLQAEGESAQKLRATLGKQMQEEMAKLNAKWKKKVQESETVREQLSAEVAAIAELMAETEFERDVLAEKNASLESELQTLQEDALEGVDDIIADKDETIKLHIHALNSAATLKHHDDETINRLEIELNEEAHISRLISNMDRRALENWQRIETGAEEWLVEESILRQQLAEAGKACVDLEEAVSRREEEAKALRYEVEQVAVALTEEKIVNEAEIASLKEIVETQIQEIDSLRDKSAADQNQTSDLVGELRVQVDTLLSEKASAENRIRALEEAEKEAQEEQEQALEMISSLEAQVSATSSSGDVDRLKQELSRALAENAQLQNEHESLDEQAAEALLKSESEIQKLEMELTEARTEIAELTDLLEQVS